MQTKLLLHQFQNQSNFLFYLSFDRNQHRKRGGYMLHASRPKGMMMSSLIHFQNDLWKRGVRGREVDRFVGLLSTTAYCCCCMTQKHC